MSLQTTESFSLLSLPEIATNCQTYYKTVIAAGSNKKRATAVPLLIVHGGPLLGHDYCIPLQELAHDSGISAVIFYDQLGCGKSTHVPKDNSTYSNDFWDIEIHQLKSLVDDLQLSTTGFYLFGHCLGSILGLRYAATQPEGLRALVVANAMTTLADLRETTVQLLSTFPSDVAKGIIHFEEHCLGLRKETSVSLKEYIWASNEFRRIHFNRTMPLPSQYWNKSRDNVMEVMDTFTTIAGGRVRFLWGGTVSKYDAKAILHKISIPTLVVKGEFDLVSESCQDPILQLVPDVCEVTLKNASHILTDEVPIDLMDAISAFVTNL